MTRAKRLLVVVLLLSCAAVWTERQAKAVDPILALIIGLVSSTMMGVTAACNVEDCTSLLTTNGVPAEWKQPDVSPRINVTLAANSAGNPTSSPVDLQVPVSSKPIPGGVSVSADQDGSFQKPILFSNSSVRVLIDNKNTCRVAGEISTDGVEHFVPLGSYTKDVFLQKCTEVYAFRKPIYAVSRVFYPDVFYNNPESPGGWSGCYTDAPVGSYGPYRLTKGAKEYFLNAPSCFAAETVSGSVTGSPIKLDIVESPDSKKRYTRTATGFKPDTSDPDWSEEEKAKPEVSTLSFKGSLNNAPSRVDVVAEGTNTKVRVSKQNGNDLSQAQVRLGADLSLLETVNKLLPGTGIDSVGDPGMDSGSGSGGNTVQFPSDYARAGEAKQAADSLKGSIDGINEKLTSSTEVGDPAPGAWSDPWGDTFKLLKGWTVPGHASQCPKPTFEVWERTFQIDSHCQLAQDHFTALTTVMTAAWSVLALFILLKA